MSHHTFDRAGYVYWLYRSADITYTHCATLLNRSLLLMLRNNHNPVTLYQDTAQTNFCQTYQ